MNSRPSFEHLAGRIVTGAFILHSGLAKWNGAPATAEGTHGMASTAYPVLKRLSPAPFPSDAGRHRAHDRRRAAHPPRA